MQTDLFDHLYKDFKFEKDKKLRVIELFSGIGFQRMGMELAEIPYEVVAISEIDKFAILAYASIHTDYLKIRDDYDFQLSKEEMVDMLQRKNVDVRPSTNIEKVKDFWLADKLSHNLGDISLLKGDDFPKDIDVMTYSFPCTDLSKAGQQAGLGKGTRSGLVYEVLRILQELKEIDNLPKMPIMENVVDLIQAKFVKQWQGIQQEIEKLGYVNYQQTLNAKEYGVAQNRDRVFMVSLLGEHNYNFPKGFELEYRLKDYLEDEVDESYYLSDDLLKHIEETGSKTTNFIQYDRYKGEFESLCRAWFGLSPTLHTKSNEIKVVVNEDALKQQELRPHLKIKEATTRGYKEAYDGDGVYINRPHQKRGVVQDGMIQTLKTSGNDVGVVVSAKQELCNKIIEQGLVEEMDMIRHSYTNNRMDDLSRKENENNISATITTRADTLGVVVAGEMRTDEGIRTFSDNIMGTLRTTNSGGAVEIIDLKSTDKFRRKPQKEISPAILTDTRLSVKETRIDEGLKTAILPVTQSLRIRKLTPRETGRLMGMQDYQIDKQRKVTSNAQMYKQHGNGIVANVIGMIIGMLYYDDENELRKTVMKNSHKWLKGV